MTEHPAGWKLPRIRDVVLPFENVDPSREPTTAFTYVDISAIDNQTQTIREPKQLVGKEAPSRARRRIKAGDTLFSTVRPYLRNIALVPKEFDGAVTSTGIAVLRPNKDVDSRYLFNWTRTPEFLNRIGGAMDGTMYPAVTDRDVLAQRIPLPPIEEQRCIVSTLEQLLTRTETARRELSRIPHLLDRYRDAVLNRAFSGLTPDGHKEISRVRLIDVIESTFYGPRISSGAYVNGDGIPTLRTTDISNWGQLVLKEPPLMRVAPDEADRWSFKDQDLMVTRTGATIGKCALYRDELGPALPSAYLIRVRLRLDIALASYVLLFLLSPDGQSQLLSGRMATAQPNINSKAIANIQIPLPHLDVQSDIVRSIHETFDGIDRTEREVSRARLLLDRIADATLTRAFHGTLNGP